VLDAIFPIVEGHGEVGAVPELLRRLSHERFQNYHLEVMRPFRLPRGKILCNQDLERAVEFGARKLDVNGGMGAIFVLLDADDDCPADLAPPLLKRVMRVRHGLLSTVVVAKREYESWFLASAVSLRGRSSVKIDAHPPPDPESIRDAKGRLERELLTPGSKYSETIDQVSLTAAMSFDEARACPSFDKLYRDMCRLLLSRKPSFGRV
jgi:uncharacterized protein DUF4276